MTMYEERIFPLQHRTLNALYEVLDPPGSEHSGFSENTFHQIIEGATAPMIKRNLKILEDIGIMARRIAYEPRDTRNGQRITTRMGYWKMLVPPAEGIARLTEWQKQHTEETRSSRSLAMKERRSTGFNPVVVHKHNDVEPLGKVLEEVGKAAVTEAIETGAVVVAKRDTEETRAIAGPEPVSKPFSTLAPMRKLDDAAALVAAAKDYAGRAGKIEEHLAKFEEMARGIGVHFDPAAMRASLKFERDERLETVSLVLPVIERLEKDVARLGGDIVNLREKGRAYDALMVEHRRTKEHNQRLISENAGLRQLAQQAPRRD